MQVRRRNLREINPALSAMHTGRAKKHSPSPILLRITLLAVWIVTISCVFIQTTFAQEPERNIPASPQNSDSLLIGLKANYNSAVGKNNDVEAAGYLQQIGRLLFISGHYPQSLDYLLRAEKIFRNKDQKKMLAVNLNMLGELYYRTRRPQLARKQYDEALAIYQNLRQESGKAEIYGRIGHLYEKREMYDSAFYFQRKALHSYQLDHHTDGAAKIYENIGSIYEDLERYDSAYFYFNKAYTLNAQTHNRRAQVEVVNNLGDVLRKTGKFREGLAYSFQSLKLAQTSGERYQISSAYSDISKAYNLLARNDSAFHYLTLSRGMLNDIYSEESNKQLALLQTLYEIEKKDNEIEQLTQARRIDTLISIATGIVVVLVIVVAALIISRQRLKIRNEQKLRAQHKQVYEAQNQLMEVELKNKKLEEEHLKQQLETKTQELSSYTLHVIRKNQLLEDLRAKLDEMIKDDKRDQRKQIKALSEQIGDGLQDNQHWEEFRGIFEQVHQSFFDRLQQQTGPLTANDLRLIALIKMNLTSTDIATLLGISQDSLRVIRHRLRKKLNLAAGDNLSAYIQSI
ncbi:tetratricopeptide (TPR) repeat protein [Dyadobacter sp. BE34]|nr:MULTISPECIES: tetratricopeptide repeat protein [Dyadobacter]MDR7041439.1 tetratricopeptide (TPR) repeat protein [Dyadobacter sp. BE242]MDR7195843.1 tetratricopeptide (TPR) repeat protein [Dyadobacter sp. BE34]MDR7213613.1 tetratricopeptide (TPR) repeat protein [Dyadobacter sp. BE31]MDR7261249.1 tetratricopeptide (TPR) repeat protein [Dyadobacter sp. BE32]